MLRNDFAVSSLRLPSAFASNPQKWSWRLEFRRGPTAQGRVCQHRRLHHGHYITSLGAPIIVKPRMRSSLPPTRTFMKPCAHEVVAVRRTRFIGSFATPTVAPGAALRPRSIRRERVEGP